jgi:Fe-S-cluster-containing hydrogenase component 2/CRP-like cAMP-binding protein
MEPLDEIADGVAVRDEESLFSRDENDRLIRQELATSAQFERRVRLFIDGNPIEVPEAVPSLDALGNRKRDKEGNLIPRSTTIYDAANELVRQGKWNRIELNQRIPILCHSEHLDPIAVCRMCSVHVTQMESPKSGGDWQSIDEWEREGKKGKSDRKLVPACQHRVKANMSVKTRGGEGREAETIRKSTKMLGELLAADHLYSDLEREGRYQNELKEVITTVDGLTNRLPRMNRAEDSRNHVLHPSSRPIHVTTKSISLPVVEANGAATVGDPRFPYSSRAIQVDHDRCILCDRCVRSCSTVKPFKIIGHTGKGYRSRISFDLDSLMQESNCVQCGECMSSCPTGALTFNQRVAPKESWSDHPDIPRDPSVELPEEFATAQEMVKIQIKRPPSRTQPTATFFSPFAGIPFSYLAWNEGSVRKRELFPGEILCRQGEYASTAFLLMTGRFEVAQRDGRRRKNNLAPSQGSPGGIGSGEMPGTAESTGLLLSDVQGVLQTNDYPASTSLMGEIRRASGSDTGSEAPKGIVRYEIDEGDEESMTSDVYFVTAENEMIIGQNECLNHSKHSATITVATIVVNTYSGKIELPKKAIVYEITRNMLDMMNRSAESRRHLASSFTRKALRDCVAQNELFENLSRLQKNAVMTSILDAEIDGQVFLNRVLQETVVFQEGDYATDLYLIQHGHVKVEVGTGKAARVIDVLGAGQIFGLFELLNHENLSYDESLYPSLASLKSRQQGRRSTTCTTLDDSQLVRISIDFIQELFLIYPEIVEPLYRSAEKKLKRQLQIEGRASQGAFSEFIRQGLYQAQKMMAIDLLACTRCDECTKACAESHGDGYSRLIRDGLRYGDFLIAGSCRSCVQPYCLDGCPVDAIHRNPNSKEIIISDHCTGCGLCERNCPYGSIQMVERDPFAKLFDDAEQYIAQPKKKAVNCDLCSGLVPKGAEPFCVSSCPHDAAFRLSGEELVRKIDLRRKGH